MEFRFSARPRYLSLFQSIRTFLPTKTPITTAGLNGTGREADHSPILFPRSRMPTAIICMYLHIVKRNNFTFSWTICVLLLFRLNCSFLVHCIVYRYNHTCNVHKFYLPTYYFLEFGKTMLV